MRKTNVERALGAQASKKRAQVSDEQGQAIVEYLLMLAVTVSVVTIIALGFRKSLFKLWTGFSQEISAGCPGCPPDPRIRMR